MLRSLLSKALDCYVGFPTLFPNHTSVKLSPLGSPYVVLCQGAKRAAWSSVIVDLTNTFACSLHAYCPLAPHTASITSLHHCTRKRTTTSEDRFRVSASTIASTSVDTSIPEAGVRSRATCIRRISQLSCLIQPAGAS